MPAKKVLVDGMELWVEVDEDAGVEIASGLVERGAIADRVHDVSQDLRNLLEGLMRPVRAALEQAQPDAWSVELGLGFKGEAGIPCLTKGEANAAIKICASWKKASAA